jgi:hypothetical protein
MGREGPKLGDPCPLAAETAASAAADEGKRTIEIGGLQVACLR